MPEFATATGKIYYEVIEPRGPSPAPQPLILLHNFMSTGRSAWGPLLDKLSVRYRILLPDLPGHGRSIGYPPDFHYGLMAHQLGALFAAEGATQGHLAGCSAGGMIAQLLVDQQLMQPTSLTLVSTTYTITPDGHEEAASQALKPENFRAGRRWLEATAILHDPYHFPGYYTEVILPAFRQLDPSSAINLSLARLATWQLPVCIIHGAADEFFSVGVAQAMAAALPHAELHIVPEQPHALIFRQPWKVLEIIDAFLP